ncbi:hypothetical protein BDN71DRAFT_1509994 [Pleurotus eryngii]|uniref:Uncharacterized protein n=1 Tax=Pleurotus eryngii TaxID=5323 RepID=A0A9P5ZU79_PLEER|nr:hypothetical protein BDN71DRAFT_1509994 [Pleurotus eryngii]
MEFPAHRMVEPTRAHSQSTLLRKHGAYSSCSVPSALRTGIGSWTERKHHKEDKGAADRRRPAEIEADDFWCYSIPPTNSNGDYNSYDKGYDNPDLPTTPALTPQVHASPKSGIHTEVVSKKHTTPETPLNAFQVTQNSLNHQFIDLDWYKCVRLRWDAG